MGENIGPILLSTTEQEYLEYLQRISAEIKSKFIPMEFFINSPGVGIKPHTVDMLNRDIAEIMKDLAILQDMLNFPEGTAAIEIENSPFGDPEFGIEIPFVHYGNVDKKCGFLS